MEEGGDHHYPNHTRDNHFHFKSRPLLHEKADLTNPADESLIAEQDTHTQIFDSDLR